MSSSKIEDLNKIAEENGISFKKHYVPGSISFSSGFMGPMGNVGYFMAYDHDKAKKIVKEIVDAGFKIFMATAGLDGDWIENSSQIYVAGQFLEPDFYQKSCWANPSVMVDFEDLPSLFFECWKRGPGKPRDREPEIQVLEYYE